MNRGRQMRRAAPGAARAASSPTDNAPSMRPSDCATLVRVVAVPEPDPAPPPAADGGPADQGDTEAPAA